MMTFEPDGLEVTDDMTDGDVQCLRDVVEPLEQQPTLSMFDVDQNVPGDTRLEGQCLLGESAFDS